MSMPEGELELPIVCTLGAGDFRERLDWIAALNKAALRHHRRDDLQLELSYATEARAQVLKMVRQEQECCAFLTFNVEEGAELMRVTIVAPEAAREAAGTLFEQFLSRAPSGAPSCC
jgi:hypothetical protein